MGGHFRPLSPKSGHRKIDCFSDPAFPTENRARGPQSRHHGRSGARKASKMEPKMITFRGPAEKLKSEPGLGENPVEAVPGGPRFAQNSMLFLKALPEANFSGPGGQKEAEQGASEARSEASGGRSRLRGLVGLRMLCIQEPGYIEIYFREFHQVNYTCSSRDGFVSKQKQLVSLKHVKHMPPFS